MSNDYDAIAQKVKPVLEKQPDVVLAYLYGSQAEGVQRKDSDVDIAVLLDEKESPATPYGRDVNLSKLVEKEIKQKTDLRVLNHASPFFVFQVLKKGKLLLSSDENKRAEFESQSRCKYFDLKPLYNLLFNEMNNRLDKGEYGTGL